MAAATICLYFKYGYCKHGAHCWKQHLETRCESFECDGRNCDERHPRECRFYKEYGRCKFGESCLYDHVDRSDPVLEELERVKAKLDVVEDLIVDKNLEIKLLFEKLEFALSTIHKKEVEEKGDVTAEDEKEKSCEIKEVGDAGSDANGPGFGASNDKEKKSGGRMENKRKKKEKNCREEKENELVATIEGHSDEDRPDSGRDWIVDVEDELYKRTEEYWKRGTLGTGVSTVFQQFLDANDVIDKSDLDEEEKKLEKDALIEAKKDRDRVKMAPI